MVSQGSARPQSTAVYVRSVIGAVLAALALWLADTAVAWIQDGVLAGWAMLIVPALLLAAAIEVIVSDHGAARFSWRGLGSTAGAVAIGMIVVLGAAIRIGEPVLADPRPWAIMSLLVVPFAAAIGHLRGAWSTAHELSPPPNEPN